MVYFPGTSTTGVQLAAVSQSQLFPIFCCFQNLVSVPSWKVPPSMLDNPSFFVGAERATA